MDREENFDVTEETQQTVLEDDQEITDDENQQTPNEDDEEVLMQDSDETSTDTE